MSVTTLLHSHDEIFSQQPYGCIRRYQNQKNTIENVAPDCIDSISRKQQKMNFRSTLPVIYLAIYFEQKRAKTTVKCHLWPHFYEPILHLQKCALENIF